MPKEYDNNMTGVLFPNTGDAKYGTHTGHCEIHKTKCWCNGWRQADKSLKLAITAEDDAADTGEGSMAPDGTDAKGNVTFAGSVRFQGGEFDLTGVVRTAGPQAKNPGSKFMSIKFTAQQSEQPSDFPAEASGDDIPF